MRKSRVYAPGIVPLLILFSAAALRVDLVLVSVVSEDISSMMGGNREGCE